MIARSSSKLRPTSLPLPAMVSSSTVVGSSGVYTSSSIPAISRTPASAPCFTWLPGWKLSIAPGMYARRSRSSRIVRKAKSRTFGSAAAALSVYGACARMGAKACACMKLTSASASSRSKGFTEPPRGLRVKN